MFIKYNYFVLILINSICQKNLTNVVVDCTMLGVSNNIIMRKVRGRNESC